MEDKSTADVTKDKTPRKGRKIRRNPRVVNLIGKKPKSDNFKSHFRKRYKERTGGLCSDTVYQEIKDIVLRSHPFKIAKGLNRLHFKINYSYNTLDVIYDTKHKALVTVLPPE